jgi:hypothetical protein
MVVEVPARRHTWWRKDATSLRKESHLSIEDKHGHGGVVVHLTLAGDNGMP